MLCGITLTVGDRTYHINIEERTRETITRQVRLLEERFDAFELEAEAVTNDPEYFEHGHERAEEGWIGDAGAWVTDDDDRVLLIRHEDDPDRWGTPGGSHEPGETLAETARRKVREETGVECSLTDVYAARQKVVVNEADESSRFHVLTVEFDAAYESGHLFIDDEDIVEAQWFAEPPDDTHESLDDKIEQWEE
ncbi:NUDIX hydrolase [Haloferax namakaokahaiae]|uniref:NUDIX hydrolase n=1 Tax=Haloferax namakaokahaiae TaxID=1748331 RepID=A0ABD5ZJ94_9EURY